ncbi:MAG: NAD(+) synthase [Clostridiales bacterium]|jgi:NAD+ synthase (glutamine-hydrolysing)|nr:NAD(+) synthase [Clostridiales bacterium]
MKDGFVKAACAVPEIKPADPAFNAAAVIQLIDEAARAGVELLVFPELCLTGYTAGDLFFQPTLNDAAEQALKSVTAHTKGKRMLVFVGLPVRHDGLLYNCAAAVCDGRVLGLVPKTHLPNYAEYYEKRWFAPAPKELKEISLFGGSVPFGVGLLFTADENPFFSVAAEICEDMWAPDHPGTAHAKAGAVILVNLSAGDEAAGKAAYRRSLIAAASGRLAAGYVYAGAGAGESTTDLVFSGSCAIAENGKLLAESRPFLTGLTCISEIDAGFLVSERQKKYNREMPGHGAAYRRAAFSCPAAPASFVRQFSQTPFVPAGGSKLRERAELILDIQARGLYQRARHTDAKALVLGVSGGLDSTLALLVCVRAAALLGRPPAFVKAVTMPCFGTAKRTRGNAERLGAALGVDFSTVDITASVRAHFAEIGHAESERDVTYENAQARMRTLVLMDLANKHGGLVAGTGDMSELALGFSTYSGDHMSMYGVNAGVPKTLVRALVGFAAGETSDKALSAVLADILDTPVSPELLPGKAGEIAQKTEDIIGPYILHDFFLFHMLRRAASPAKIYRLSVRVFAGLYGRAEIYRCLTLFIRRFFAQQFKRSCLPDGPKVGSVSLSPRGELRLPSDASAAAFLADLDAAYREDAE